MNGSDTANELTEDQIDQLEGTLRALKAKLTEALATSTDSARTVELDQPIGRLSRMDAIQQQKMARANRRSHELRLGLIAAALAAIERGEYGLCRVCEEPIGMARLKAKPETPLCLGCQRRAFREFEPVSGAVAPGDVTCAWSGDSQS